MILNLFMYFTHSHSIVIGVKFLSALQFENSKIPGLQEKFVICQVPTFTEGESSITRVLQSLARTTYHDKCKLLFVICDGMIIGSGNDRPTPRIVLDVLGVDPKYDPEPLMYQAIGVSGMQLNYAKVYSGLYDFEGTLTPFVVVVKVK